MAGCVGPRVELYEYGKSPRTVQPVASRYTDCVFSGQIVKGKKLRI
jgi:hypothetical protein